MLSTVMADWFYGKDNTQHGPVSEQEIQALASSGQIDASTIVWREGMGDWIPMKDVPEFQSLVSSAAPASAAGSATPHASPQTYSPQQPYQMAPVAPTDGLSIAALICGILSLITCWLGIMLSIPAVICGHMSLKKIKNSHTPIAGKGMAMAGLICGYVGLAIWIGIILLYAGMFAAAAASASHAP